VRAEEKNLELHLGFQCDKNGWDWDGSRFTLNFDLIDTRERQRPLRMCRYHKLVTETEALVWIEQTNRVVAKLRQIDQPPLHDGETSEEREWTLESETEFFAASDPWMRFYDEEDIAAWWAEFLEPRMDGMIGRFLMQK
jgi:hypothetical protein